MGEEKEARKKRSEKQERKRENKERRWEKTERKGGRERKGEERREMYLYFYFAIRTLCYLIFLYISYVMDTM